VTKDVEEPSDVSHSADQLRDFIDSIPTLAWSAASDGTAESFNQRWLDYTGLSAPESVWSRLGRGVDLSSADGS
jgi:PAS domain-containing protein